MRARPERYERDSSESSLTRRQVLFSFLGMLLRKSFPEDWQDKAPKKERKPLHLMMARRGTDLEVINPFSKIAREINQHWLQMDDSQSPTPAVAEGLGTDLGPAIVSIAQFHITVEEIRRLIENGTLIESSLTNEEQNLLDFDQVLMAQYPDLMDLPIQQRTEVFYEALQHAGYDCIIALKNPNEMGRRGRIRLWNWLTQEWGPWLSCICLNTATSRSYSRLRLAQNQFEDYQDSNDGPVVMRWIVEVSTEIKNRENLQTGRGSFYRLELEPIIEKDRIDYPQYQHERTEISPDFRDWLTGLSELLASPEFFTRIEYGLDELSSGSTPRLVFETASASYDSVVAFGTELNYLLHRAGIEQAVWPENRDFSDIHNSPPEFGFIGVPIGNYLTWRAFSWWFKARALQESIMAPERWDLLENVKNAVFFIENVGASGDDYQFLRDGLLLTRDNQQIFILFENGAPQIYTRNQIQSILGQAQQRIKAYW